MTGAPEHLIDLSGLTREFVLELFAEADRLRAVRGTPRAPRPLAGYLKTLHRRILRAEFNAILDMEGDHERIE